VDERVGARSVIKDHSDLPSLLQLMVDRLG